jgi:MarR family transcriptional regulator, temperature-dependent positive regulator of motility
LAHTTLLAHLDPDGTRITVLAERAGMTKQSMGQLVA